MKDKKNLKYLVKQNNYIGLLFFALVLAATLYIIKHETNLYKELEPTTNNISNITTQPKEINKETEKIKELRLYMNDGDLNTFKIYQSMYNIDNEVTIEQLDEETMLYIAYKYLEKTTDFSNNQEYITCQEAEKINLAQDIIQCGGNKTNITNYTINNHITKDLLNKTITKIFNRHITNYTNFYTSENNLCYYINNEYLCVSQKTNSSQSYAVKEFVKAYEYQDHLEIIEKYYYVNNNIHYQGFNTDKVGEATYISTFKKTNGSYYWNSTKLYNEN